MADIYISRDDWTRAKEYLAKVIRAKPDDFTNVEALAEVLRREGKPDEARKVVEDFLTKHPTSAEASPKKAIVLQKSFANPADGSDGHEENRRANHRCPAGPERAVGERARRPSG